MSDKEATLECIWECRRTKIELEHEVLLREMDACLIALAGYPMTVVTLILQFELWKNSVTMTPALMAFAIGTLFFDYLRSDRKEKVIAKQKELDKLILEIIESSS